MTIDNHAACYAAFQSKDSRFDGHFFVGVTSTGIYCRPVCRARLPRPENCTFFKTAAEAERDQLKRDLYLAQKGLTGEEAEFIAFKAGKMVDDKTTFEQAVDALTAERKKTTFDWTAPVGGGSPKTRENDVMNALIRGALK